MKEFVKDFYGRILGSIETDNQGNKIAKDFFGMILGYYDKRSNTTQNKFRQIITQGDCLSGLILQNSTNLKNNKKNGK